MTSDGVNEFCHYATAAELDYLRKLATQLRAGGTVVMIGAGPGVMAMAVLEGNPDLLVNVVDRDTVDYLLAHVKGAGLPVDRIGSRICDSAQAGREWVGTKLALLIVDGDHSYEGVRADMLAWLPHLAAGGYVFFHDYSAEGTEFAGQEQYPGVALAVSMYLPAHYTTAARVGTAMVFQNS